MAKKRNQFVVHALRLLGGLGAALAFIPFIDSWMPNRSVKAAAGPIEVDISGLQPGERRTVAWRGKPVWIIRRSESVVHELEQTNPNLRDPDSQRSRQPKTSQNATRSIKSEYLVVVGVCTHLGCIPLVQPSSTLSGKIYCPCHGSIFDLAGRVMKAMPAATNLEVPPYRFVSETRVRIGEDEGTAA